MICGIFCAAICRIPQMLSGSNKPSRRPFVPVSGTKIWVGRCLWPTQKMAAASGLRTAQAARVERAPRERLENIFSLGRRTVFHFLALGSVHIAFITHDGVGSNLAFLNARLVESVNV